MMTAYHQRCFDTTRLKDSASITGTIRKIGAGIAQSVQRLATGWTTERSEFGSWWWQEFLLLHVVRTGSVAHPASYAVCSAGCSYINRTCVWRIFSEIYIFYFSYLSSGHPVFWDTIQFLPRKTYSSPSNRNREKVYFFGMMVFWTYQIWRWCTNDAKIRTRTLYYLLRLLYVSSLPLFLFLWQRNSSVNIVTRSLAEGCEIGGIFPVGMQTVLPTALLPTLESIRSPMQWVTDHLISCNIQIKEVRGCK
jgi:hypothetical protein